MPSFTSSSEGKFLIALVLTFSALLGTWEGVLRSRGSANIDFGMDRPELAPKDGQKSDWVVFGNCLMMTGVSPKMLATDAAVPDTEIVNIAWHEQSPIAFFEYLKKANHYPKVIIANVSSWLNGTNFEQEAQVISQSDPLHIGGARTDVPGRENDAFHDEQHQSSGAFQRNVENGLTTWVNHHAQAVGHRYHLFDYSLFLAALVKTRSLDDALYQLNMQSWFRVDGSETDGFGWLGLKVHYREDWDRGLEQMADRSLQRLRLSRSLTPHYWAMLEDDVKTFRAHGTRVVLVRMPEHPRIRDFNEETYELGTKLKALGARTGATTLDLSELGPSEGVHLFDAVHPDADSASIISRRIAEGMTSDAKRGE